MIAHSMVLMVTGESWMLRVQDASHGAGQTRPVNSGKLLVESRLRAASRPVAAIGEIVPVGDLVVDRTADVTIGDAAIHAARRLIARRLLAQRQHELAIVADSVGGRRITPVRAIDLQKPRDLAHLATLEPVPPLRISRAELRSASITRQLHLARTLPARPLAASAPTVGHNRQAARSNDPRRSFDRRSSYSPATSIGGPLCAASSASARRYSTGITLRNFGK